ncbi:MAG: CBS domain-containing protein [Candidatus Omnitrophica bacterium]|nr:CBS domain-containing protein [Candidatus Omnitrophota bacterium]MCA9427895.1 CBS domain-containing protein [Candidatus Omnitrophota bacterium]MCA9430973.1 CBS domain-containing protein [Candidatus Omnitrophota bacterium]MCA9437647.1 CBS domain-containing protein [Candidatus Omnitrophota bacterium]MCA9440029.1 CBS domain-containing protein [Candidatus Omnitrophota bacterium]
MKTVRDVLDYKGYDIWSVSPEISVFEALKILAEKDVGALLVMEGEDCVGIFTERDYARKVILVGRHSKEMLVHEIMTPKVMFVRPEQTVEKCLALMTDKRVRHFPVMEDEKVVGLISIGDIVRAIIHDKQLMINELEDYIWGRR